MTMTRSERRLAWLFSWYEAQRRQPQALAAVFLQGLVGFGLVGYFRLTPHNLAESAALGLVGGCSLTLLGIRYIRDPRGAREGRRGYIYEAVTGAIGLTLIVAGIGTAKPDYVVAGLPFLAMSLILFGLKRMIPR
jgi:hypothetical protein